MARRPLIDFNGDGRSDILLRDLAGTLSFLYGTATGGFTAGPSINWGASGQSIVGLGDFNGDGRSEFLLTSTSNDALISGLQTVSAGFQLDWEATSLLPSGWFVAATGNFNGDPRTDILLRHLDGRITNWLIGPPDATIVDVPDAPFLPNPLANYNPGPSWQIAGTGDFNGDGLTDIFWRHDSGLLTDWIAQPDGSFYGNSAKFLTQIDDSWHIVGIGDFNGDGRDDILWIHNSGLLTDWIAQPDGSFYGNSANFLSQSDPSSYVAGTGDFNGDGKDDILFRNSVGFIGDWLGTVTGSFVNNFANSATWQSPNFQIQPNPAGLGAWDY